MRRGMQGALDAAGVTACVTGSGSLAHVHFCPGPVRDYREAQRGDGERTRLFHLALLERGVVCASRGMFAASTVMTMGDIDALVAAVGAVGRDLASCGG